MKNLKIDNYKEKIENALRKLDMYEYINFESYNLSMGQKQRITIAGVVACMPKYLILDEPTSMIDPAGKEEIYKLIKKLKKEKYTIVYITNFIDEILMSDKVIVIEDGRIINFFKRNEILNNIEFLKEHGIKIPELVDLVYKIKNKGINLDILNWDKEEIIKKIINRIS